MGRRRSNILQDLFEIGGVLPWWRTALLALASYAVLHQLAVSEPAVVTEPQEVLSTVFPNVLRKVAVYAQYIVPWLLIVGMLTSVLRRATRAQFLASEQEGADRDGAEADRPAKRSKPDPSRDIDVAPLCTRSGRRALH
jgi:hypothetical protein